MPQSQEQIKQAIAALESLLITDPITVTPLVKENLIKTMDQFNTQQRISVEIIAEHSKPDAHNEFYKEETLVKACENFNTNLQLGKVKPNLFHLKDAPEKLTILKTYIIPVECMIGNTKVEKGTWVGEIFWNDEVLWKKRSVAGEDGTTEIAGVSIGGRGFKVQPVVGEEK